MSRGPTDIPENRLLPGGTAQPTAAERLPAPAAAPSPSAAPSRQLQELPKDELEALAEEFGLDVSRYPSRQHLVAALHGRRQLIASLDREAMLDVVKWGRRPIPFNASREQMAQEICRIKTMKFSGLSQRGLLVLARLRGVDGKETESIPMLVKRLKRQEGFFARLNRKRRSALASMVANLIGEEEAGSDYQFLPPQQPPEAASPAAPPPPRPSTLKEEIEESGLLGGIAGRLKKSADSYVNQKLDEIEARIDRKLDEIDRRLGDWRDKEIANRIRILKITLWASVIVAAVSLLYSYVSVYLARFF